MNIFALLYLNTMKTKLFDGHGFLLFILNFINQKSPHFHHKNFSFVVQNHLNIVQDGLRRAARQHLRADEVGQRGFRFSDVFSNLLVDPRSNALLHKLIVYQVPVYGVLEEGSFVCGDLFYQGLDVFLLVVNVVNVGCWLILLRLIHISIIKKKRKVMAKKNTAKTMKNIIFYICISVGKKWVFVEKSAGNLKSSFYPGLG